MHTDGTVTGAIFETDNGNVQVNAQIVILATGGYPANPDMVNALAPIVPQCVTAVSYSPKDRGAGIKAAIWAGAVKDTECAPMIFNRGAVAPGVDCGYVDGQFPGTIGQLNYGSQPFMKVNRDGKRFFNESSPYDFNCFAASLQKGGVWCSVFDANMVEDVMRFHCDGCAKITAQQLSSGKPIDEVYAQYLEDGIMIKADTLEELRRQAGLRGRRQGRLPRPGRPVQPVLRQPARRAVPQGGLSPLRHPHRAVLRHLVRRLAAHHLRRRAHQRRVPGPRRRLQRHRRPLRHRRLLGQLLRAATTPST